MAYSYTEAYRAFRGQQAQLVGLLQRANQELSGINMPNQANALAELEKKVRSDSFKIQVTGTFKNGKSTFINAFLGEEVLPAYALPCTAVINEVRYGKEKKAVLYFRDPLPEQLPAEIPSPVLAHMRKHGMKKVPPVVIPYDQIEKYVVIPMGKDPTQMLLESPYEKVVLYWPLPLLSQGVQIIDSPGLNEHATRTRVTMDYLSKADAILFVLSAQALCAKEEMTFLENSLAGQGFMDPIFVVNRFDCIPEREKPAIVRFAKQKLERFTSYGPKGIFFTSALNALEAKKSRDSAKLKESGMMHLEMALSEFLIRNKGRVKLAQPAAQLSQILNSEALERSIPMQKRILSTTLSDVKHRYNEAKPRIEQLTKQKELLRSRIDIQIRNCYHEFYQIGLDYIQYLTKQIGTWLGSFEPDTKLGSIPSRLKAQAVVREMTEFLAASIEENQQGWRNSVLSKYMDECAGKIFISAQADILSMRGSLDQISDRVSGGTFSGEPVSAKMETIALTKIPLGKVVSAEEAGVQGISQNLAKSAAMDVGAGLLLSVLGVFNPVILCAIALGTLAIGSKKNEANALEKIKAEVTAQTGKQLREQSAAFADQLAKSVQQAFCAKAAELIGSFDTHISGLQEQMQAIISEMEQGQAHIKEREQALQDSEDRIRSILKELDQWHKRVIELTE